MRKNQSHGLNFKWVRNLAFSLAALLLFAQWSTLAHAASFGFDDHAHNGVACEISIVSENLDDLVPSDSGDITWILDYSEEPTDLRTAEHRCTLLSARPRGPPSHA